MSFFNRCFRCLLKLRLNLLSVGGLLTLNFGHSVHCGHEGCQELPRLNIGSFHNLSRSLRLQEIIQVRLWVIEILVVVLLFILKVLTVIVIDQGRWLFIWLIDYILNLYFLNFFNVLHRCLLFFDLLLNRLKISWCLLRLISSFRYRERQLSQVVSEFELVICDLVRVPWLGWVFQEFHFVFIWNLIDILLQILQEKETLPEIYMLHHRLGQTIAHLFHIYKAKRLSNSLAVDRLACIENFLPLSLV